MAKVKKSTVCKNVCLSVAIALALAAFCMLFVTMVETEDRSFKGYQIAMSYHEYDPSLSIYTHVWDFSFFNFSAYMLVFLGIICCVAGIANKKQGLVLAVLTMLLFVSAGVLFLCQTGNLQPHIPDSMKNSDKEVINQYISSIRDNYQLATGAIVAAACSISAGLVALLSKITWQVAHAKEE